MGLAKPAQPDPVRDAEVTSKLQADDPRVTVAKMWMAWLFWRFGALLVLLVPLIYANMDALLANAEYIKSRIPSPRLATTHDRIQVNRDTTGEGFILSWRRPDLINGTLDTTATVVLRGTNGQLSTPVEFTPAPTGDEVVTISGASLNGFPVKDYFMPFVRYRATDTNGIVYPLTLNANGSVRFP